MARSIQVYRVNDFFSDDHRNKRQKLSRLGKYVQLNVINSSDIPALINELHQMQKDFEEQIDSSKN